MSVAVTLAVGVNADGRREGLGMAIGASEAETFWTDFLRSLAQRGLHDVKLVISDAHEGIKSAVSRVFSTTWSCAASTSPAMPWPTSARADVVSAFIATAYAQETPEATKGKWRK